VSPGEIECLLDKGQRLLQAAGQQHGFAQRCHSARLPGLYFYRGGLLHRLLQQRQGLGETPGQGIRRA